MRLLSYLEMVLFVLLIAPTPLRDPRIMGLLFISSGALMFLKTDEASLIAGQVEEGPSFLREPAKLRRIMIAVGLISIVAGAFQIVWFWPDA